MDQSEAIRKVLDSVDEKKYPWIERHGCIVVDKVVKWVRWNDEEVYMRKYLTGNIGKKTAQYLVKLHNDNIEDPLVTMYREGYVSAKSVSDHFGLDMMS